MKLKITFLLLLAAFVNKVSAQDPVVQYYANKITASDLKEYLSIIASDAMEGRETGKRGQKMAAAFISAHFEEIGLKAPVNDGYLQLINLYSSTPDEVYVKVAGKTFNNYDSFVYFGNADSEGEVSYPLVFAGNGRKEDFDQLDVKDKVALILLPAKESYRTSLAIAREKGAKSAIFFDADSNEAKKTIDRYKQYTSGGSLGITKPTPKNAGIFFTTPELAAQMMNTSMEKLTKAIAADVKKSPLKKIKPSTFIFKTSTKLSIVKSENVLGYLEGSDKKDELVVVTAHYDHIGKKESGEGDLINNGADDDGSGTVSVMELAKIFAQAKKDGKGPRRSMLFMTVTGEEEGLLGSGYYSENPVFPLDKTVVDLNIDMIGRRDPQHKDSAPYVYAVGSDKLSMELHKLSESINQTYTNLILDYTYNDPNHPERIYQRSDHWNFAKKNIPIIFYFDGIHEDYHRVSDEVSKIEFDLLAKRAQLVFYTAWEIANRDARIMPDINQSQGSK
jgi:hypothetical protein